MEKPTGVGGTARVKKNNSSTQVSDSTHRQGVSNLHQKRRLQTAIRVLFVGPSKGGRKALRLQRGFLAPTIPDELNLFVGCSRQRWGFWPALRKTVKNLSGSNGALVSISPKC